MEEDTEYLKQSLEDRLVHKLWKARVHGYEEAAKLFRTSDDDKELGKFLGLVKKFVSDSNAAAQERGLEAAVAFAENYQHAGKSAGEVLPCLVAKCLSAAKARTRELAVALVLCYVELERGELVVEELLKGADHKNPKTQAACIAALTQAIREFGSKAVGGVKPAAGKLPALLEHRDKGVRDEAMALALELLRWVGPGLRAQLASACKPVQLAELDAEFDKVKADKPTPTRFLRSQQKRQEKMAAAAGDTQDEQQEEEAAEEEVDPMDLLEPVDILAALPKDLLERLEAKKWQDRKEALDQLEALLAAPKLAPGDFADLVRALKKTVSKDSNVVVVASAVRCLGALARGLHKRFAPYAGACVAPLLDKFKEKKPAVVTALRDAVDAVLLSTSVEAVQEDVVAALDSKNPQVKTETAAFLARAFTRCTAVVLNKKLLKGYVTPLLKLLADPDPAVRDAAADAVGTALRVVGEKTMAPLWADVDATKQAKIRDCAEKAVITAKAARPASAPAKMAAPVAGSNEARPVARRPATAAPGKKPAARKAAAPAQTAGKASARPLELSAEELEERAALVFTDDTLAGLSDSNWKTRLAAMEAVTQTLGSLEDEGRDAQVLLSALSRKPGLRDTNFQVLRARLEAVKLLAETTDMQSANVEPAVRDIVLSLGDAKNGTAAADALTALATATALGPVALAALDAALAQKSPKVQVEALAWVTAALEDFGCCLDVEPALAACRRALETVNPAVRAAAVVFAGALYVHVGAEVPAHFEADKPQQMPALQAEFAKRADEVPAAPTRAGAAAGAAAPKPRPAMPHTDISGSLDDKLLAELADKNWKVRMEALQRVSALVTGRLVAPALGELPALLCQRLADSNAKIAAAALQICTALAAALGAEGRRHLRTFFPAIVLGLGDSKAWIREAALACLAAWEAALGVKEFFSGGEMVAAALASGSPQLRAELCAWLANALAALPMGGAPKEELATLVAPVLATLDDRSPDVRKSGNAALAPLMAHVGNTAMQRHAEKLKPASRPAVLALLEKARHCLPVPAELPTAAPAARAGSATITRPAKPGAAGAGKKAVGAGPAGARPATGGRKREEEDATPPLQSNKLKNQRCIDEQKLRILKWNFTTPRDEFVELLRDQLTTAGASKTLIANMFHADFKFHLKAIDQLSECLATDEAATEANLDLILKWMTLRFFDTNPSVLLRGLDYLQATFDMLWQKEYHMFETEASSFLPYLIVKVGDPKDAVRNGVRALVKLTDLIYPRTKLFQYLLDGIKSKNARQRTECLELLGYLLERYGLTVCGAGSPAPALREIARQISDRDNSVRNAALNCVVHAWHLEGDRAVKMLGQIGDKEMSLLEERIKRAGKKPPPPKPAPLPTRAAPAPPPDDEPDDELDEPEEPDEPVEVAVVTSRTAVVRPRPAPGPFGLDSHFLDALEAEADAEPLRAPRLHEFDLDEFRLNGPPLTQPNASALPRSTFPTLSPPRPLLRYEGADSVPGPGPDRLVAGVSSADVRSAVVAMNALDGLLLTDAGAAALAGRADALLCAAVQQLRQLRQAEPTPLTGKAYRTLLMLLMSLYKVPALASTPGKCSLRSLLEQLLTLLAEDGLAELEGHQQLTRVVNMLVVRVIDKSEHTQLLCALITLLDESVSSGTDRYQQLVMKCVWKVVKLLPAWEPAVGFDIVLHDVHTFFKEHPGSWWRRRGAGNDLPLRTVKTVLHAMVKLRGAAILSQLDLVDDAPRSELAAYLVKLVKAVKVEEPQGPRAGDAPSPQRLSKSTHELLSEIFKKIGSKETTQDGLSDLFDFKQAHPEADIEPFLAKSSDFFQRYIEEGMRAIALQRATQQPDSLGSLEQCHEASYYLSRLRCLQQQAGIETEPRGTDVAADANNRLNEDKQELSSIMRPTSVTAATNIDQLRLRLDLVKGNRLS